MPKTIKRCFYEKLTMEKLYEAHLRAKKNKTLKKEVLTYELDLETNLSYLLYSIKNKCYTAGQYRIFTIYEPKERTIKSLPYKDRIVHQWYVEEFIKPYFMPRFIKDTYACIPNRGMHKAVIITQKYMRIMKQKYGSYYVLKCDIKKYFYTIDKDILMNILKKYIKDKDLLEFSKILIYDNEPLGIPIGNYTSQFFANIYLNELDQYLKHNLHIKYLVRFMDDFIILCKDKSEAKELRKKINDFVTINLKLQLNDKTRYYPNKMGIDFCGYRIFETHILLRKRSIKKINKNIKKWNIKYLSDNIDYEKVRAQFNSWLGHSKHSCSFNLRRKVFNKILFKDKLIEMNVQVN